MGTSRGSLSSALRRALRHRLRSPSPGPPQHMQSAVVCSSLQQPAAPYNSLQQPTPDLKPSSQRSATPYSFSHLTTAFYNTRLHHLIASLSHNALTRHLHLQSHPPGRIAPRVARPKGSTALETRECEEPERHMRGTWASCSLQLSTATSTLQRSLYRTLFLQHPTTSPYFSTLPTAHLLEWL
jgi:hypothetical protein